MSSTNRFSLMIDRISATVDFSNITITYEFYSNDELCFTIQKPFKSISFMMWEFISNHFMSYSVGIKGEPYILNESHDVQIVTGKQKYIEGYNRMLELYDTNNHLTFIVDDLTDKDFRNITNYAFQCAVYDSLNIKGNGDIG